MASVGASLVDLLIPHRHRRAWAAVAVLLTVGAGVLWASPASPTALSRADAALGRGDASAAARVYDAVALHSPWPAARTEALYRGALVYARDLGDTETARRRLHILVEQGDSARAADGWEEIGHLRLDEEQPRAAARAFRNAWEVAPQDPRAGARLALAARARTDAGDLESADRLWMEVATANPDMRGHALLARAEIHLADGDAEAALGLYEEASRTLHDWDQLTVARLGMVTCLERLGDLEGALATIDGVDLPADVIEARRAGLRARQSLQGEL